MSENDISTINRAGYEMPQPANLSTYQQTSQAVNQALTTAQEAASKSAVKISDQEAATRQGTDVSLEFKIDPHSQDITVLILDKSSRKVIRTIPPEEISKLHEGDLVELFR